MSLYRVSGDARRDLDEIWRYIARDNPEAADQFVRVITLRFNSLASQPHMGRLRKELSEKIRSHAVGNYIIFYRPTNDGIEIVRILHGARDLPPLFE